MAQLHYVWNGSCKVLAFEKAFDSVSHPSMLDTLILSNIPCAYVDFIARPHVEENRAKGGWDSHLSDSRSDLQQVQFVLEDIAMVSAAAGPAHEHKVTLATI